MRYPTALEGHNDNHRTRPLNFYFRGGGVLPVCGHIPLDLKVYNHCVRTRGNV